MTETDVISTDAASESPSDSATPAAGAERRRRGGITGMVLAELRELAGSLGVDTTGLRRGDLIAEIRKRQSGGGAQLPLGEDTATNGGPAPADEPAAVTGTDAPSSADAPSSTDAPSGAEGSDEAPKRRGGRRRVTASTPSVPADTPPAEASTVESGPNGAAPSAAPETRGDTSAEATTEATTQAPAADATAAPAETGDGDPTGQPSRRNRGRRGARRDAGSPSESSGDQQGDQPADQQSGGGDQPAAASTTTEERRP